MTNLCLSISLLAIAGGPLHATEVTLSPATVVEAGQSPWVLAVAADAPPPVRFAAAELQRYIEQMSGCRLAIATAGADGPAIMLGLREALAANVQANLPASAGGHDGYAIAIQPKRIVIAGDNGRGVVYGAYDLLERLGCRWFYPTQNPKDPEVVPKTETLRLEPGRWAKSSRLRYRICNGSEWFFKMNLDNAAKQLDWAMKNRYNTMGVQTESETPLVAQFQKLQAAGLLDALDQRGMWLHGPAHSFDHFLKADEHMAEHPEWFGMRDGKRAPQTFAGAQFCWSNAEARKVFTENVARFVEACPALDILCIVPFDGGVCCTCPECEKLGASNALMTLMREVIARVERIRPDMPVETVGGYNPMTEPPTDVEIHPRQRVVWAHWGRIYDFGYDTDTSDRKQNLERWRQAARGGITLCQYYTDNFAEPWVMAPFAIAMEGDRRYFLEKNIDAIYMLMWPPGYWWNHSLNGYLAGRCFYDASLSPFDELEDYALRYFGPAVGPLLAEYFTEWARNVELSYRIRGGSTDADRATLAAQRAQWIEPAIEATRDDPVLAARVSRVTGLHTLAERLMEAHRQRQVIRDLYASGALDEAEQGLEAARTYTDEILAWFYALADREEGLIDRKEVPTFIQANVKNWLDEEAKAIAEARHEAAMDAVEPAFVNPIREGADPWVIQHGDAYYTCRSEGDLGISVFKSDRLTDAGIKRIVWKAPKQGWNAKEVWAPELHHIGGRWYIYYAASDGKNANHRSGVLEATTDHPQGPYIDKGMLYTGDAIETRRDNRWSIDLTPLELGDRLYAIWSGWPAEDDVQYLYIAPMANPWTISGNRVKLCANDTYLWERVDESASQRGLHEAPQVIQRNGKVFAAYSCSGSWQPSYKQGMLWMPADADPLDPKSWTKLDKPVMQGTPEVLGVGHVSFVQSPDRTEDWIVYHAKVSPEHGWRRAVSIQPFGWTTDGFPDFGQPVLPGKTRRAPSGEPANQPGGSFIETFGENNWDRWSYYGYNRYIWVEGDALTLGGDPGWGLVNHYRTGEKALVRGYEWSDLSAQVRVRIERGEKDAGLLFRVRRPALGYDAQRGYFAGLISGTQKLVLGKTDGRRWQQIALVDCPVQLGRPNTLGVEAIGPQIRVFVDGELKIEATDRDYDRGMVGVRVVDVQAWFDDFRVDAR